MSHRFMGMPLSYWARVEDERDEARAKLYQVAAQCVRAEEERDEARAIAGELARFIRAMLDEYDFPYSLFVLNLMDEWRAIRPGVRKYLEGK